MTDLNETRRTSATESSGRSLSPSLELSANVDSDKSSSSGFVLKLYQMVNGAPDDMLSWVSDGEAFRISSLSRLESEVLPIYFRHSRFQSLVRQLNFYNFRKINRERTFWIYHHPMFHRDRPEDLHKLRRRTCPGVDGRRNRPSLSLQDFASPSVGIYGNEDYDMELDSLTGEESASTVSSPLISTGVKVSRSPSPSSSYSMSSINPPSGRGSLRLASIKSLVSEEENSPIAGGSQGFCRTVSSTSTDMIEKDEVNDKNCVVDSEERRALLGIVADVSQDLHVICSDFLAENYSMKLRGKGRNTRHGIHSKSGYGGNSYSAASFGLEKPEMHYSHVKTDLLTYDDEYDLIFEDANQRTQTNSESIQSPSPVFRKEIDLTPPCQDEGIITTITTACREGNLFNAMSSVIERSIESIILKFFLATHPEDPYLSSKIVTYLKSYPILLREFLDYCQALNRGVPLLLFCAFPSEDLKRDWITFSMNHIHSIGMAIDCYVYDDHASNDQILSKHEYEVTKRFVGIWFGDH